MGPGFFPAQGKVRIPPSGVVLSYSIPTFVPSGQSREKSELRRPEQGSESHKKVLANARYQPGFVNVLSHFAQGPYLLSLANGTRI
jgi:hypothetical protein